MLEVTLHNSPPPEGILGFVLLEDVVRAFPVLYPPFSAKVRIILDFVVSLWLFVDEVLPLGCNILKVKSHLKMLHPLFGLTSLL